MSIERAILEAQAFITEQSTYRTCDCDVLAEAKIAIKHLRLAQAAAVIAEIEQADELLNRQSA